MAELVYMQKPQGVENRLSDLVSEEDMMRIARKSVPIIQRLIYGTGFAKDFLREAFSLSDNIDSLNRFYNTYFWQSTDELRKRPRFRRVKYHLQQLGVE